MSYFTKNHVIFFSSSREFNSKYDSLALYELVLVFNFHSLWFLVVCLVFKNIG